MLHYFIRFLIFLSLPRRGQFFSGECGRRRRRRLRFGAQVLDYTLARCGWCQAELYRSWEWELKHLRGPPAAEAGAGATETAGGGQGDQGGQGGDEGVMLRVEVLRASPPPSRGDFEAAAAQAPGLAALFEDRFPELSRGRGRRFLVYALQASGGTIFTQLLAQTGGSVAILDLWAAKSVPRPEELGVGPTTDVFVKAVVNTKFKFTAMVETFRPHVKVRSPPPAIVPLGRWLSVTWGAAFVVR